MNRVAQLPPRDRDLAFAEAAARMGLGSAVIIEKDFWVCWTLAQVFSTPEFPSPLFKGGTSLSKAYQLIERFSEDVDLVLDRHALGFTGSHDPAEQPGSKQRKRTLEQLVQRCAETVRDMVLPALTRRLEERLTSEGWSLEPDPTDPQALLFAYPRALGGTTLPVETAPYLRPVVRLEFGCRGDMWPSERRRIRPYLADNFPQLFETPDCEVEVLRPDRTFWEKLTLMHAVFHTQKKPQRLSRHYYDVSRLYRAMGASVCADHELLVEVATHKQIFFREAAAHYETARPGSLRLVPGRDLQAALRTDWREMQEMMFGAAPDFDEILADVRSIEELINGGASEN